MTPASPPPAALRRCNAARRLLLQKCNTGNGQNRRRSDHRTPPPKGGLPARVTKWDQRKSAGGGGGQEDRRAVTPKKNRPGRGWPGAARWPRPWRRGSGERGEDRQPCINARPVTAGLRQGQRMEVSSTTKGVERMAILFLLTQSRIMGRASPSRLTVVPTSSTKETSLVRNS